MFKANNLTVHNHSCTYHFHSSDEKYVRNGERQEFKESLWNSRNMDKFVDPGDVPKNISHRQLEIRNDQITRKRNNAEYERESKRIKPAPPCDRQFTPVLVPGDRDVSGKRILPVRPTTVITDKHHRSYRRWLTCWNKVVDMSEKRKKELKKQGNLSKYEKLVWPVWTPQWKKRTGDMWWWDLPGNEHRIEKFKKELVERHNRVPINMRCDSDEDEYPTEDEFQYESDFGEPTCEFSDME